jgi:integrase
MGARMARRSYPGVYQYAAGGKTLWFFKAKRTSRRGFTSASAAHEARMEFLAEVKKGAPAVAPRETFGDWWARWLTLRRKISEGTRADYEAAYKRRLVAFADMPLAKLTPLVIADQFAEWDQQGDWAPKTLNNTRTTMRTCMQAAVLAGLIPTNPVDAVEPLAMEHLERDWLRPDEVARYLEAAHPTYRPLAEFLIGTGARISEAIHVRLSDLALERNAVIVYRSGKREGVGSTKGKRFRPVTIGPRLVESIRDRAAAIAEHAEDPHTALLFPMPRVIVRGDRGGTQRFAANTPMSRNTVSRDWHKDTLEAAGLRDMPLHALRHTAAAAWLSAPGGSLAFVQRQLGHRDYKTTEEVYGHLAHEFMVGSAAAAEALLYDASAAVTA